MSLTAQEKQDLTDRLRNILTFISNYEKLIQTLLIPFAERQDRKGRIEANELFQRYAEQKQELTDLVRDFQEKMKQNVLFTAGATLWIDTNQSALIAKCRGFAKELFRSQNEYYDDVDDLLDEEEVLYEFAYYNVGNEVVFMGRLRTWSSANA
ncbi:hypothetical protein CC86DRAFT_403701 [Ophiobolus disseminans]|uniref:Uncharacterized protein n=1 Tax=Ophiobolus disseminans TaxID=1469910 RepID=A0A6A7A7A7_9PLEO|nr:hypothetical protein CC86DRAFT_403701 [Ophiobolus disseminans]